MRRVLSVVGLACALVVTALVTFLETRIEVERASEQVGRGPDAPMRLPAPEVLVPGRGEEPASAMREEARESADQGLLSPTGESAEGQGPELELTLRRARDGRPWAGRSVRIDGWSEEDDWAVLRRTDEEGRCTVPGKVDEIGLRQVREPGLEEVVFRPRSIDLGAVRAEHREQLVVEVLEPPAVLEALVLRSDGAPAAGAIVAFGCVRPPADDGLCTEEEEGAREGWSLARTDADADGRARLAVWFPERFRDGVLLACTDEEEISDPLPVPAGAIGGLRTLVVRPGGVIRVETLAGSERAPERVEIRCECEELRSAWTSRRELGSAAEFRGLAAGRYDVSLTIDGCTERPRATVDLARGAERVVALEVPGTGAPVVQGVVLDEGGRPLPGVPVLAALDDGRQYRLRSGEDGSFRLSGSERGSVRVRVCPWSSRDRFEPSRLSVPAGTTEVVVRRVAEARPGSFEVEVVDARTRRAVEPYALGVAPPDRPEDGLWFPGDERIVEVDLVGDEVLTVLAPGYLALSCSLHEATERRSATGTVLLELLEGFERRAWVRSAETEDALEGAVLACGEVELVTDERGSVLLRASVWAPWTVRAEGHRPVTWDPRDDWYEDEADVWLQPLPSSR